MKTPGVVMVPCEGSTSAEQAVALGGEIARRAGAVLRLVQVHLPSLLGAMAIEAIVFDPLLDTRMREAERAYLQSLPAKLGLPPSLPVVSELVDGEVSSALIDHIRETSADLVVMSTHAREPVSRFWLGSVADRLSRTIPVPLLLLPQGAGHWGQGFRRILVTLDGSPLAESALEPACMIGRLFGASLRLVHVVEPAVSQVDLAGVLGAESVVEMERQGREWGLTYLSRVAGRLQAAQTEVTTRVISAPTVATGVLSEAADGIDLIAIASHGRGGFRRLILGSVADKIIRGSPVPVLLCHTAGKD